MAVAHATAAIGFGTDSGTGDTNTGDQTFSHAGSASAKGAFVIVQGVGTSAHVTGVLYGGTAMDLIATCIDATEAQSARIYFLGASVPTGTQTVTLQGCTASQKHAVAGTVTAATAGTQIVGSGNLDTQASANPSLDFNLSATGQVYGALCGGAAAETSYGVGTGETLISQGPDYGALSGRWSRSTSAAGAGTYTFNFTYATSDDWAIAAIAIGEAVTPTTTGTAKLSLAGGSTPETRTAHEIHVVARVTSGAGKIRAALYEGSTNITDTAPGYLESNALTTSLVEYTLAIADADAATIGSYSNLDIWLWGYSSGGGSIVYEVDQVWLEIPAAGADVPTPGGAVAGGVGATAQASVALSGASAQGLAATSRVAVPQGGASAQGPAPTIGAAVPQGGAVAGGVAPGEPGGGISETPTPGGATAAGAAPTAQASLAVGGALAAGPAPAARASAVAAGAVAGGTAPSARASQVQQIVAQGGLAFLWLHGTTTAQGVEPSVQANLTIGGAIAGGYAPTEPGAPVSETPVPGGATAGGLTPAIRTSTAQGGATAQGTAPLAGQSIAISGASTGGFSAAAGTSLTIGGGIAGGFAPAEPGAFTETPTPGGATSGGLSPAIQVSTAVGGAVAQGTVPTELATQTVAIGGANTGGFGATAVVTLVISGGFTGGYPPGDGSAPATTSETDANYFLLIHA